MKKEQDLIFENKKIPIKPTRRDFLKLFGTIVLFGGATVFNVARTQARQPERIIESYLSTDGEAKIEIGELGTVRLIDYTRDPLPAEFFNVSKAAWQPSGMGFVLVQRNESGQSQLNYVNRNTRKSLLLREFSGEVAELDWLNNQEIRVDGQSFKISTEQKFSQ